MLKLHAVPSGFVKISGGSRRTALPLPGKKADSHCLPLHAQGQIQPEQQALPALDQSMQKSKQQHLCDHH